MELTKVCCNIIGCNEKLEMNRSRIREDTGAFFWGRPHGRRQGGICRAFTVWSKRDACVKVRPGSGICPVPYDFVPFDWSGLRTVHCIIGRCCR